MNLKNHAARALFVSCMVMVGIVQAQTSTGEITGTITDSSGAVVVDATVTLTNSATNAVRTAKSNGSGLFDLPALPPGTYNLNVGMQGFASQVIPPTAGSRCIGT